MELTLLAKISKKTAITQWKSKPLNNKITNLEQSLKITKKSLTSLPRAQNKTYMNQIKNGSFSQDKYSTLPRNT